MQLKLAFLAFAACAANAATLIENPVANIDSSNFLMHVYREGDERPEDTFRHYIADIAKAGYRTAVFCVCSKRTNYDSAVWDAWWKGFDPDQGPEQPFFQGTPADETAYWYPKVRQYLDFHRRGVDYPEAAVRLARQCGMSPWLSIRMNDVHNGAQTNHFKHGSFVSQHPEFRRKPDKTGNFAYALDYAHAGVRTHYLNLIRELLDRYDMDGLELDFMRAPFIFSQGEESAGCGILNQWLAREVKPLIADAEKKRGHAIRLGARVPSTPETAIGFGLDVTDWIAEGIFDVLVPTPHYATIEFDMPWDHWLALRGSQTTPAMLAGMEPNYRPCPQVKSRSASRELFRGAAANALSSGADGIYTFNQFPIVPLQFLHKTSGIGNLETILSDKRTHAITYRDMLAPGETHSRQLPFSRREGTLRLRAAPIKAGDTLELRFGLLPGDTLSQLPEVVFHDKTLRLETEKKNPSTGLTDTLATWTAQQDIPAGDSVLRISWNSPTKTQIRSVELSVIPGRIADAQGNSYDLAVDGGTPGGIACAVRAAREGLSVLLVNHTGHLGGFVTSGAGGWEAPSDAVRSPLYGETLAAISAHYAAAYGTNSPQHILSMPSRTSRAHIDRAKVEPRVAETVFNKLVKAETNLTVLLNHVAVSVARDGRAITSVTFAPFPGTNTAAAVTVRAKVFADAMYEGDLLAAAGCSNRIGREARAEYNEPHAGVLYTLPRHMAKGQRGFPPDADKGLLNIRYNSHATAGIVEGPHSGEADASVMAYNWRLILTGIPSNRVMVAKPADYDHARARKAANGGFVPNLPNGKVAWNGGRQIGPQVSYPAAAWPERERIARKMLDDMLAALWFMQNDPAAPADLRKRFEGLGLPLDEFPDNAHIPYEIYVREARRLVGRAVFTEHDNLPAPGTSRTPVHPDSVAFTDWPVDSVACQPRKSGKSNLDGIFFLAETCRPAQVPYRCLLPKEVDNLLVPVALSASHVGWGSIRLEPLWMQTGEAAGFAAALAVKGGTTPAALDPDLLIRTLVKRRVMVSFFNDADPASGAPSILAAQYFGTKGFFASYDARLDAPLTEAVAALWRSPLPPAEMARAVHAAENQPSPPAGKKRGALLLQLWNEKTHP